MSALWQTCATTVVWVALFQLNAWFFGYVVWSGVISWIFLPAAVRLLSVMLFNWRGTLGLWLGTLATNRVVFEGHWLQSVVVATISACAPLLAMYGTMRWLKVPSSLRGLTAIQLAAFAVAAAVCSVVPHNLFFWLAGVTTNPFDGLIPMFVGDIAGTVIVLYLIRGVIVAIERIAKKRTT